MRQVIQITGYKNSGKTTLISNVIPIFNSMNIKVAVIKHDVHGFESDIEDTDTYKLRQAGAVATAITSPWRTAIIEEKETPLQELIQHFKDDVGLIIVEGFKREPLPKMVMISNAGDMELMHKLNQVAAVVYHSISDMEKVKTLHAMAHDMGIPIFEAGDLQHIAQCMVKSSSKS